jgi:hypothetical protein
MNARIALTVLILLLTLLLPMPGLARAETVLLFTGNTHGEHSPCPT